MIEIGEKENVNNFLFILKEIGYRFRQGNGYLSARALYRNGSDPFSLTIYPKDNLVVDWVTGDKFSIKSLIAKTLNIKEEEVNGKFNINLQDKIINSYSNEVGKIDFSVPFQKIFPEENLRELEKDHSYWESRGINREIMELFDGGVCHSGKLKGRYCIPIYDSNKKLIGITGRTLRGSQIKWMTIGVKRNFLFPLHLNKEYINKSRFVILVESPSCIFKLWSDGIKETICLFGVFISNSIISCLLSSNVKSIIISTNNESSNIGNNAAIKIKNKLIKFFDKDNIVIKLPYKKDFAMQNSLDNKNWRAEINI